MSKDALSNFTRVSGVAKTLERGKFDIGTGDHPQVILGSGIAATLGVEAEKEITDAATLTRYRDAWDHAADRTPHGMPIELQAEDFTP